eukprot:ANDGO_01983.mRNA.1 Protein phosphatase 2C homolog 1
MGNGCRAMCTPRVQDPELNEFFLKFREIYSQTCKENNVTPETAVVSGLLKFLRIPTWPRSQRAPPPRILVNWSTIPCGDEALIAFIAVLRRVKTSVRFGLSMKGCAVTELGVKYIPNDVTLYHLDLSGNTFAEDALIHLSRVLANNESIRVLMLSSSKFSTRGFEVLSMALLRNTTLKKLSLHGVCLDDSSLSRLSETLKQNSSLQDIDISANTSLTMNGIESLVGAVAKNHALTCLKVDSAVLDPKSGEALRKYIERNLICTEMMQLLFNRSIALVNRNKVTANRRANSMSRKPSTHGSARYQEEAAFHDTGEGGELETDRFHVGHAETIGRRPTMEDVSVVELSFRGSEDEGLFELFDGHGGRTASTLAGTWMHELISESLDAMESMLTKDFSQQQPAGVADAQNIPVSPLTTTALKTFSAQMDGVSTYDLIRRNRTVRDRGLVNAEGSLIKTANGSDPVTDVLTNSFLDMNDVMIQHDVTDGTTALVCYIRGNKLWMANAGDSRGVLSRNGHATRLSIDHVPVLPEEEARIEKYGGFVSNDGRVNGVLAVSRALGDLFLQPMVSPEPYVFCMDLKPTDNLLVMACDGLWDVMDDQYAIDIAKSIDDPRLAAVRLRDLAYHTGSTDNISVSVIRIKPLSDKPSPVGIGFSSKSRRLSLNSSLSSVSSPRIPEDAEKKETGTEQTFGSEDAECIFLSTNPETIKKLED